MREISLRGFCIAAIASLYAFTALGQTIVGPDEVLTVTSSSSENFQLNGGTLAPRDVTLSGQIELQDSSKIIRPQNNLIRDSRGNLFEESTGPTNLDGPIVGTGGLEIGNESRDQLFLSGNNTYSGITYFTSGQIFTTSPTAFGGTAEGTIVRGANLTVQAPTDEQFRIEEGLLSFRAGNFVPSGPLTIAGGAVNLPFREHHTTPLIVDGDGGAIRFGFGDNSRWTGGSSGIGNLEIGGRIDVDEPLNHDGDLIISRARLNAVNGYTGKTIIKDDYEIDRPDVFGTSTTPIEIDEGSVTVNVLPNGDRGFIVRRGTLDVQTTTPINAGIVLEANILGIGTFNGPIDYITDGAFLGGGVFNGPIRGDTRLLLGDVTLNAANEMRGLARVNGGHVIVNHQNAITLASTQIEEGVVEFNVPVMSSPLMTGYRFDDNDFGTLRLNVDQVIDNSWAINEGVVESNANVKIKRLVLLGIDGIASATTTDQGSLEIGEEIRAVASGDISGKIKGTGTIRGVGRDLNVSGNLTEYSGDLVVERGFLSLDATTPLGDSNIYVKSSGQLRIGGFQNPDYIINNDIFLQSTGLHGGIKQAGLHYSTNGIGDLILRGRLDVGEQGAMISSNDGVLIEGELKGRDLTLRNANIVVKAPQETLRGTLIVDDSTVSIVDGGALKNIDAMLLSKGATLYLPASNLTDRIQDSITVRSQGSHIQLLSNSLTPTSETLGTLQLESGYTSIVASSDHGSLAVGLSLNDIVRQKGTVLHFREVGPVTTTKIGNVTKFDDKMIGAWAVTRNGFASVNEAGFLGTLAHNKTSISSAAASDHVFLENSETLSADATIASLHSERQDEPIDLGGHKLTIVSGGMFRTASISNGQLTAGNGNNAELVVHESSGTVSADIIDNPMGGSVALVINSAGTRLAGNNSYSGGTWVIGSEYYPSTNATAIIESLSAIPTNDRVYVDNAVYEMQALTSGEVTLDELHIRNGGFVSGSFLAPLSVQQMFLEDGRINAKLVGNGSIVKRTNGTVDFTNSEGDDYEGNVTVQEGLLSLNYDTLPNADFFVEGGRLQVSSSRSFSNRIVLDGGAFQGNSDGEIQVLSDSILYSNGFTTVRGALNGNANLTVQGTLDRRYNSYVGIFGDASQFSGNWNIESGSLRIGAPGSAGTGEIHVSPGARLILGSDRETSPPTNVSNTIYMRGGTLISTLPTRGGVAPPASTTGDVFVAEEAYIGAIRFGNVAGEVVPGLSFEGRLILEDNSAVFGLTDVRNTVFQGDVTLVDVSGQLLVGQGTTWNLLTSTLAVTGSISPLAQQGTIDFVGIENSLDLSKASFALDTGQSLAVLVNGNSIDLTLSGTESGLSGNGTFTGNLELTDGATISPGNSPGELTVVGDTTIGSGAIYEWEIASHSGAAGDAWDLLQVDGDLRFTATDQMPWTLQISDLSGFSPGQAQPWLIASANSITGFNPEAAVFDISGITDVWPTLSSDDLRLFTQNGGLYLQAVPEPTSLLLVIAGCFVLLSMWRP